MSAQKLIFIYCCLVSALPSFACQRGGKFYSHCDRKLSKKEFHVGPDRTQQRKQAAWEVVLSKKAQQEQKAVVPACPHKYSFISQAQSTEHVTVQESTAPSRPYFRCTSASKNHNLALMTVFTLLCIAPCAAFCADFPRLDEDHDTGGTAFDVCHQMTQYINLNRGTFERIRSQGRQIHELDGRGVIDFPPIIEMACPPDLNFHWRIDHSWDWYHKGRAFLDDSCAKYKVLSSRIDEYNKHVEEHNKQVKLEHQKVKDHNEKVEKLLDIDGYVGGKYYHLNPAYQKSFDLIRENSDAFFAKSHEEFQADPLIKLGAIASHYEGQVFGSQYTLVNEPEYKQPEDEEIVRVYLKTGSKEGILALMAAHDEYVSIAKNIMSELADCTKVAEIKQHALKVLSTIGKGPLDPVYIATELYNCLQLAKKDGLVLLRLNARLDELGRGLLYAGTAIGDKPGDRRICSSGLFPGIRILCTPTGICGIGDAIMAELGGAKTNFVQTEMHMKDSLARIDSAQDLLRLFKHAGEYAGTPYIGNHEVNPLIRSLEGGEQLASLVFQYIARYNKVGESGSAHNLKYKLVLGDGTQVAYWPTSSNGDAVIVVGHMPAWIATDTIEFRFRPMQDEERPSSHKLYLQDAGVFSATDVKELQRKI